MTCAWYVPPLSFRPLKPVLLLKDGTSLLRPSHIKQTVGSTPPPRPSDPGDRAFDRTTGEGFVAACQGQYADALAKGHDVSLHHAESTGALGPVLMATLRILARQSRLQGATDLTHYGEGRASSKAFLPTTSPTSRPPSSTAIHRAIQVADADSVLNAASHRSLATPSPRVR